jgi:hypothetical protein
MPWHVLLDTKGRRLLLAVQWAIRGVLQFTRSFCRIARGLLLKEKATKQQWFPSAATGGPL